MPKCFKQLGIITGIALGMGFQWSTFAFTSVCERTEIIKANLEWHTKKKCDQIQEQHLRKIPFMKANTRIGEIHLKPGDFDGLVGLKILDLSRSRISKIDSGTFKGLDQLISLDLGINFIENLTPDSFEGLSSLKDLKLDRNKFTDLPSGLLHNVPNLSVLFLQENQIEYFPENFFEASENLTELRLSQNRIANVPENLFVGLSKLKVLTLDENPIKSFFAKTFEPMTQLQTAFLQNKELEHIPDFAFVKNLKISNVSVSGPLTLTSPAAFAGVPNVDGLPPNFNVDPEFDWEK